MKNVKDYKITVVPPIDSTYDLPYNYICVGEIKDDIQHGALMREYGSMVYGDNSIFNILDEKHSLITAEYFLQSYGNVILYNLSDNFGILCIMNEIDKKQRDSLELMLNQLEGYTIEVDYCNDYFDEIVFDEFEDSFSDDFNLIRNFLDNVTIKEKERIK